ncbi:hypothetical protein [Pontiella sp.]|uniref:hypothetical protein n=1 Tax=Pontiella sp. TaxID=2837462 RepID=UPI003568F74C
MGIKALSVVLSSALLTGCATQEIRFTSYPSGARVVAGKKRGTTPCTLKVPEDLAQATFSLPAGQELVLPMPEMDSDLKEVGEEVGKATGGVLMVAGGAVGLAGLGVFLLAGSALNDDDDDSSPDSDAYAGMGIGLLGMVVGGGVYFLGKWIFPDHEAPVLHAEFEPRSEDADPLEEERYEDVGFGAKRLKSANR